MSNKVTHEILIDGEISSLAFQLRGDGTLWLMVFHKGLYEDSEALIQGQLSEEELVMIKETCEQLLSAVRRVSRGGQEL